MSPPTTSRDEKRDYYSDPEVVRRYEQQRFLRGGGRYVAEVETRTIAELIDSMALPAVARALDCPTGTGRLLPLLARWRPLAVDISLQMLGVASRHQLAHCCRGSASALPLGEASVDLWLMSRFAFHFADLQPFLREAARVLVPHGHLLFDTYHWTPRSCIPGGQSFLGGRVHVHATRRLETWLGASGFEIVARRPVFALAPYLYGLMPHSLPPIIDRLAAAVAPRLKAKSYVLARKAA